ncbi:MAG TPA: isoleucine--tRNA ligase, partial [Acidimicrobiaceae bacterium]|nr:isoleucine--tRNA ligase [Acidimicrobiaceae bacterium]
LGGHARFVLRPDGRALGPRLGSEVQAVFAAARSGRYDLHDDGTATVAGHLLQPDEFALGVESPEGVTAAALGSGDAVVVLDTAVTDDLAQEGLARDVVRQVQQARRDAELVVTDRIRLVLDGDNAVLDAVRAHEDHVAGQVLATELAYG